MRDVNRLLGADIDSDYNLLLENICPELKKIVKLRRGRPRLDLETLCAERQEV
jgi:hypothetical protein